jgi:hypothetical protein
MLLHVHRKGKLATAKSKSSRLSCSEVVSLPLESGSISFLKNGLKKNCIKNCNNHLRSNTCNHEVCTAVARCFPNILDVGASFNLAVQQQYRRKQGPTTVPQ